MEITRRRYFRLAGAATSCIALPKLARTQGYPSKPVRVIVGLAAGGVQDIVARLMSQWLSERFGQPFVVENRTGGGGNIATEAVVRAAPDGHTLLLIGPPNAINATLYRGLSFDFLRDIAPVASVSREPQLLLVNPSVPAKSVAELIAHAKTNPGKLNFASAGIGSGPHLSGELFKMMTGIDIVHVPYRGGGPALTDLISGQVQFMFSAMAASSAHARAGKLRALAVTTVNRSEMLPKLPTVGEFVAGYEASAFIGIGAPKNTPADIITTLNRVINTGLSNAKIRARFSELGGTPLPGSSDDFGKLIAEETHKWAKVIKLAGLKPQ